MVLLVESFERSNRTDKVERAANNRVKRFCSANSIPTIDLTAVPERSGEPLRVNGEDYIGQHRPMPLWLANWRHTRSL
jgi:hypothetical protein